MGEWPTWPESQDVVASGPSRPRDTVIWTLDARDSMLLEVMAATLSLTDAQVRTTILQAHEGTVRALQSKGLSYAELRNGLVPQKKRREVGLLFLADEGGYGIEPGSAADSVLTWLPANLTCAVLRGDLLARDQDWAFEVLERHLVAHKSFEIAHTSQIYAVYLNNLSDAMLESMTAKLTECHSYVGYVDSTFGSPMKDWLASTLTPAYLKVGRTFLNGHPDDVEDDDSYDAPGWPLERHGFMSRSLQGTYVDLFLTYKIERRVLPGETDTKFALSAISEDPRSLHELEVVVDDKKLGYLREQKLGILTSVGLESASREAVQSAIRTRIGQSYIYELEYKTQWGTSQFNVMLELFKSGTDQRKRVKAVLSYQPGAGGLRLISLY